MREFPVLLAGIAAGIVGALPPAVLFERALRGRGTTSVAAGLASILASFALLSAGVAATALANRNGVLAFGMAEAATFLLVWAAEAVRAWCDASRGAGPGERKKW